MLKAIMVDERMRQKTILRTGFKSENILIYFKNNITFIVGTQYA